MEDAPDAVYNVPPIIAAVSELVPEMYWEIGASDVFPSGAPATDGLGREIHRWHRFPLGTDFGFDKGSRELALHQEISSFLADVERRAFKQAMYAVRDEDAALDIVQDAMLKLTENYSDRPVGELPMLFQRILQNAIHDHFRRQKVRSTWTTVLSALGHKDDRDEEYDPLETLAGKTDSNAASDPAANAEQRQTMRIIEQAISRLPPRQREAFLLRYWEELDVAETAAAMGCSEGSVKTHCSRAVHALAEMLEAKGMKL
jgi:RNA polymerase sigma-70 factor (ECF subfamily)